MQIFDRDKSGTIDADELRQVLKSLGMQISAEEALGEAPPDGATTCEWASGDQIQVNQETTLS